MTTAADLALDLARPWRHGEHVDARNLVLDTTLVLDGLTVRGLDLSGACLNGGVSARGARFAGLAWLRGVTVRGRCDLTRAQFGMDLRADGLRADALQLDGCQVHGVLSLAGAQLRRLTMRNALVMANMTLEGGGVAEDTDISGSEILGGLWSAGARLGTLKTGGSDICGRIRMPRD